jgi:hypothetical protein
MWQAKAAPEWKGLEAIAPHSFNDNARDTKFRLENIP